MLVILATPWIIYKVLIEPWKMLSLGNVSMPFGGARRIKMLAKAALQKEQTLDRNVFIIFSFLRKHLQTLKLICCCRMT